jgi:pyrroloquinoline quinone (PQQ) biosynthesis protein C
MATPLHRETPASPIPNASDFVELYAFERPGPALPVEQFLEEMRALVRQHRVEDGLATALRYGTASRDAMRRWIKDSYQFVRWDAQGTAAAIARCRRRGLFIACSPLVSRKTGHHQVTRPALELFLRFAAVFDLGPEELEAHFACPETMQATYTRQYFQFSSFEEGFVVSALASEGALLDVHRDERPWLCQRGMAEYMKRAWKLDDDAVAYWRAYEDFRGFVTEPVWELAREIAVDASQQQVIRTALHHWLLVYTNMRRAWNEIAADRYRFAAGAEQTYEEMEDEIGEFCMALARPAETAFGYVISGKASLEATKELVRDFIHLDATRKIAGQMTRLPALSRPARAIAQAFATESGAYLTRNHMEIWADFAEQALGITREEMFRWTPPTETIASGYVTAWFLVHGSVEEAIAAFHLGPPTRVKERMGKAALGLGQGGVAGEGLIDPGRQRPPLAAAFERLGIDPDLAEYFFRLHREIEPFEQDEGWEYVPIVIGRPEQFGPFKRAYMAKILSERRKDEGLLRRMKQL